MSAGAAALAIGLAYLVGAIPVGAIVGRLAGGIDLLEQGSRRTGSTNVLRTLGTGWAAAVLALDVAKGLAAVLLARFILDGTAGGEAAAEWGVAAAGAAAIIGHNWSIFLGLRGGRGVATAGGGLLGMAPLAAVILAPVMLAVIWRWRYVSLGSIVGALLAPLVTLGLVATGGASTASVGYGLAIAVLVTASHRDNIGRLRAGTERKIGQKEGLPANARG